MSQKMCPGLWLSENCRFACFVKAFCDLVHSRRCFLFRQKHIPGWVEHALLGFVSFHNFLGPISLILMFIYGTHSDRFRLPFGGAHFGDPNTYMHCFALMWHKFSLGLVPIWSHWPKSILGALANWAWNPFVRIGPIGSGIHLGALELGPIWVPWPNWAWVPFGPIGKIWFITILIWRYLVIRGLGGVWEGVLGVRIIQVVRMIWLLPGSGRPIILA